MMRKRSAVIVIWSIATALLAACLPAQQPTSFPTAIPLPATRLAPTAPAAPFTTTIPTPFSTSTLVFQTASAALTPTPYLEPAETAASVLDVWDDPANENSYWHRQTQLITGERVLVVSRRGEWAQIIAVEQPSGKHALGYPGWARIEGLMPGWSDANAWAVVMSKTSLLRTEPGPGSALLMRLFLDTRLPFVDQQGDRVQVRLPGGQTGWLPAADIRLASSREQRASLDGLFDLALSFAGTPYLWGGTVTDYLDCSGFTYRLFHAYGINLGRDSGDQLIHGTAVDFDFSQPVSSAALRRGDLLFFTEKVGGPVIHVGIAWGNGMILDTNTGRGLVLHSLADMKAEGIFHSARRVVDFP